MTGEDQPRARRVAVVDDDDWSRTGLAAILAADARIEVVAALTHDEALTDDRWLDADVVVVDAADDRRTDDQFPGVAVVERARAALHAHATVIAVTGYFWDSAVRVRMKEAGADLLYYRPEVQDGDRIRAVVLDPDLETRAFPAPDDDEELFRLGINPTTRVNRFVTTARELGWLDGQLARPGRRTRRFEREREQASTAGRVHPVNADGTPPDREQSWPGRPQLARLLDWATRVPQQRRPRPDR